ncbi:MAG TPA: hypothetical protein HA272_04575 [Methanoregula sp.]|nr:hypothetical protein [Methanoregula sp.]
MDIRVRRFLMFCTILTVGLLLLFIDVTLIQLILLLLLLAVVLPFLLGLVTIAEVRAAYTDFREQKLKKIGILKKLDEIKLFEKKGAKKPETLPAKTAAKPGASPAKPASPGKMPFAAQIGSLVATFKSLGTVIGEHTRRKRKVDDINRMLDSTVSEKVEKTAASAAAPAGGASRPVPGGAGSGSPADADPFLSLSEDEFDSGLLDGLDEGDLASPGLFGDDALSPKSGLTDDMELPEPELSMPDLEMDAAAADILKANAGDEGLDEFSGLEAGGDSEADFGDLENISLDDVDLDADFEDDDSGALVTGSADETAEPATAAEPAQAAEPSGAVKTTWIPSDAPGNANLAEDQIGMQSDMAAFASSSGGTDEDLLSSIASDVKHVTKEKDLSLLRELKDFKAPADQIEKELTEIYQRMSAVQKPKEKTGSATNEIK